MSAGGTNSDQRDFWDRQAGPKWVRQAAVMDGLLEPVLTLLLERAAPAKGDRVLDIGCGSGASSRQVAGQVGPEGLVLGVDISESLLARARTASEGTAQLQFLLADAQTHAFAPATFDLLISRFGVMFFEDSVAAFANMAQALKPGGALHFAAWGAIPENPYFTLPAAVARDHFGESPPRSDPDLPGPFAFREPARIEGILAAAGLAEIEITSCPLSLNAPCDAATLARCMADIGPIDRALAHFGGSAADREALIGKLAEAMQPWERDGSVKIPALVNMAEARVPI